MSEYPTNLRYVATHEWVKLEEDIVLVGISDHAQDALGDVVYVELPEIDASFQAGDEIAVVESVKAASDIYAPVAGTVIEVNSELEDSPELVNESPYAQGCFFMMKADDPAAVECLLVSVYYQKFCDTEDS